MKIAVVGAGAIGGYLAVKLSRAGNEVTCIARGPNLAAIQAGGMKLLLEDGTVEEAPGIRGVQRMADAGVQDVVLLTLKAHQVKDVAPDMRALFGPDTMVVTMQNGIPWWYFHKLAGDYEGTPVTSVDPDGIVAANIEVERVIGSVVYPASELIEPGFVKLIEGNRFTLGELDGSRSPRIEALSQAMIAAGFKSPVSKDIRSEMWVKLWGNLSFNPISALDARHAGRHLPLPADPRAGGQHDARSAGRGRKAGRRVQDRAGQAHRRRRGSGRAQDIDAAGCRSRPSARIRGAGRFGARTGGCITGIPTPNIDAVYALVSLLARTLSDKRGKLSIAS
jgi:2-dehydropantoate 2-reductase